MQFSLINKDKLVGESRIDAEAYLPIYYELEKILSSKKCTNFSNETVLFAKGIFDINAESYIEKGGIPFVRILNLGDTILNDNKIVEIPKTENDKNKKTYLKRGDLILSKTAYPAASYVDIEHCNTSQDTIAIKLKKDAAIKSKFLAVYLNTSFGLLQMKRWFTGNVQMHLNLTDSSKIIIPVLGEEFQNIIAEILDKIILYKNEANDAFRTAGQILLEEVSLDKFYPNDQLSFIANYSKALLSQRLDAEYYQPKFESLVRILNKYPLGYTTVGASVKIIDKNFVPSSNQQYNYVELANISVNGSINGSMVDFGANLPTRARRRIRTNDVIVSSIEGSLDSIAMVKEEYDNSLCSTGFYVLRSNQFNPETLLVIMKSLIGQLQLKKGCSGTILTAINKTEIEKIVLPKVRDNAQIEIKKNVDRMYEMRAKSKKFLDISKLAVEKAIRSQESYAIKFINQEIVNQRNYNE